MYPRNVVCFRYIITNTIHKADNKDNNNNNNNIFYCYIVVFSCHRPFLPVTSLEPAVIPTAQASSFTLQYFPCYVRTCDVPRIAVFCSESTECFPSMVSTFFFKRFVTLPVARIFTGILVHYMFHIRCASVHKLLYFNLFSFSFGMTFLSACIGISVSVHVFSFLFLIIISALFTVTSLSACTTCFHLLLLLLLLLSYS